ncbi:MocR-like pyridoxine biosynthesis transcription factor PdxR [Ensifer adhaerens]|uniref:MocR-like pyridoxine biosynthesis transcription factor PdxR n=1 Tax=Ensifer adhaerens TaxID=106592 RepID=UPI001CF0BDC1|nr:PLP-dependent aminotransferase family protein [Ensifer adhaerens]UCM24326.1 PLP-dependent aminotransferase family protein [Ensifer adhaerens]
MSRLGHTGWRRNIARTIDGSSLDGLILDADSARPLYLQLYDGMREMILSGTLPGGMRIPSSRVLSESLGISRFTVVTALDQLVAEGYLKSTRGSGTYVETVPRRQSGKPGTSSESGVATPDRFEKLLSRRGQALTWRTSLTLNDGSQLLHMATPDHRLFPVQIWSQLTKEVYAQGDFRIVNYREIMRPSLLEEQIARHIAVSRGIRCEPEEVVTTLGAHHAVTLLAELLLDPGDTVAFEEPGMAAIRSIFQSSGCKIEPMHVDASGPDPHTVASRDVKLAFVTAAKQQPMTVAMPMKRKLELLHWAADRETLIIEDDLGSEFRYRGGPIPPLKALDQAGQVIYIGAFSMTLLQSLRVGYMIMPRALAERCRRLIQVRYRALPQFTEQIVGRFIEDGHYVRHLHRMRRIYAKRQNRLLQILRSDFADIFEPPEFASGFYNLCYFRDQAVDEDAVLVRCRHANLGIEQLSYYYANRISPRKALLVGFAASTEEEIPFATKLLRRCLDARADLSAAMP